MLVKRQLATVAVAVVLAVLVMEAQKTLVEISSQRTKKRGGVQVERRGDTNIKRERKIKREERRKKNKKRKIKRRSQKYASFISPSVYLST